MKNSPLSSTEQSKVFIFSLLSLPLIFPLVVGVVPAIFLIFGIVMMKKNSDFSHITTAVKNTKIYASMCLVIASCFALWFATSLGAEDRWDRKVEEFFGFCGAVILAFIYIQILNKLFYKPLHMHEQWVALNGIFTNKVKVPADKNGVDIIRGERLKSFSVADELTKWAKLKEDGHITEKEYNEARKKLLAGE